VTSTAASPPAPFPKYLPRVSLSPETLCRVDFSETMSVSCLAEHLRMLLSLMGLDCLCVGERDWTSVDCSSLNWTFAGVPLLIESCPVEVGLDGFRRRVRFLLEVHSAVVTGCIAFASSGTKILSLLLRRLRVLFVLRSASSTLISRRLFQFPTKICHLCSSFVIWQAALPQSS
jgi:hypothetical protein